LSDGQRDHDIEVARTNIAGEMFDLAAAGLLAEGVDPVGTANDVERRYQALWHELHAPEQVSASDRHRMEARIRRLQSLGFDVEELTISESRDGAFVEFQPRVVEPGHHCRRLLQLTGLDVQENQARRLLTDMAAFRAATGMGDEDEEVVAHSWLLEAFQPTVLRVPRDLRGKLEPAEIFHEVLEHRWYLSEAAGREVELDVAADSYVNNVLAFKPDEAAVLGADLTLGD
jgi:hypothetical protein